MKTYRVQIDVRFLGGAVADVLPVGEQVLACLAEGRDGAELSTSGDPRVMTFHVVLDEHSLWRAAEAANEAVGDAAQRAGFSVENWPGSDDILWLMFDNGVRVTNLEQPHAREQRARYLRPGAGDVVSAPEWTGASKGHPSAAASGS